MAGITLMFLILFRNITLALIGAFQILWLHFNFRYNWIIGNTFRHDDNYNSRNYNRYSFVIVFIIFIDPKKNLKKIMIII